MWSKQQQQMWSYKHNITEEFDDVIRTIIGIEKEYFLNVENIPGGS